MKKRKKIIIGIVIVISAGIIWYWYSNRGSTVTYNEVSVERGDIQVSILSTGVVEPQNRLELKPPIAGRIETIFVQEGDAVKKSQKLALLSSTERAALIDGARAQSDSEVAKWEDLYKPTPLFAPLDGVIIARRVEPGQTVTSQDVVLVMSDRLILRAQVDETDIGMIGLNQKCYITLDAYPEEIISGVVDHIAFEATTVNNVTIYEVEVLPQRVPHFMRSGMTANVKFIADSRSDVLILPAGAITQKKGRSIVLLAGGGKGKEKDIREIKTGLSDGKNTEIVEGLNEGDTVVMTQIDFNIRSEKSQGSPFMPTRRRRR